MVSMQFGGRPRSSISSRVTGWADSSIKLLVIEEIEGADGFP
jgi:hypothetical protein